MLAISVLDCLCHPWNEFSTIHGSTLFRPSMEPRPFRRGDDVADRHGQCDPSPSMEPRPFRRGDPAGMPLSGVPHILQWSHALSGVETPWMATVPCARRCLQWSHALSGVETREKADGGESGDSLQWSHALSGVETSSFHSSDERSTYPSMEPRPFRRGDDCPARGIRGKAEPSMEPRPFRRGDNVAGDADITEMFLQWSHALSGVETDLPGTRRDTIDKPSMEPRPFRRGDNCLVLTMGRLRAGLQWSHALSGVETPDATSRTVDVPLPSMEPRPFRRGDSRRNQPHSRRAPPSMEPRPFRRGDECVRPGLGSVPPPSMEPRPFRRGDPIRLAGRRHLPRTFNGATPFQAWRRVVPED